MKRSIRFWLAPALCVLAPFSFGSAQTASWEELTRAGHRAFERQQLAEAERQFKAAIKEAERFGHQDLRLATSFDNLAEAYRSQNKPKEAEKLFRQSLAIREMALGPWHIRVAQNFDSLADALSAQRKYSQAEPLYRRAREIRERALARHPETYVDEQPKPVREPR